MEDQAGLTTLSRRDGRFVRPAGRFFFGDFHVLDKRKFEPSFDRRRKIVGVMGGKTDLPELTRPVGCLIASMGFHLLTGGGRGVMEGVSEGFATFEGRQGSVIGVIRSLVECAAEDTTTRNYIANPVNPWVEIPLYTHLPLSSQSCLSRNHINVLTSDVVIALPGNEGTASEIELAFQYGVPLIFFTGGRPIAGRLPEKFKASYPTAIAEEAESVVDVERLLSLLIGVH
jgi:uncharacterized protein (TIGR00725 family)